MRKMITRSIIASTINSSIVKVEKGKPVMTENAPITVNGKIDENKALKEVRKAYGENAIVTSIDEVNATYEISVEDFIKYATKLDNPSPEQKEE